MLATREWSLTKPVAATLCVSKADNVGRRELSLIQLRINALMSCQRGVRAALDNRPCLNDEDLVCLEDCR